MSIIQSYILKQVVRTFSLCLSGLIVLFLIIDFFDRIDNILPESASFWLVVQYFLLKIPLILALMMPVAMLIAVLLTFALLSKSSEMTAMRASGMRVLWLARPVLIFGLFVSVFSFIWNETAVPFASRRVKEIYHIDIQQKDKTGNYSKNNLWWRSQGDFYSADIFDSRSSALLNLSVFELNDDFLVSRRTDAQKASWINRDAGWTMTNVQQLYFAKSAELEGRYGLLRLNRFPSLALPIRDTPSDFYDFTSEPESMSMRELRGFIKQQQANGLPTASYLADLYNKVSFPFLCLIVIPVVLPFAVKSARSGSMALSFVAGISIAFSYHAVHSFSLAMGRAELWPPLLSAWMANIVLGLIGLILCLGAEAPE